MAKVFVTGLDGFTGRYMAEELIRSGHEVCGIVHKPVAAAPWRTHVCDLLDTDALVRVLSDEKPDAVVHLAAIAFVQHGDVGAIYQTNVVGTRNLLDALTRAACQPRAVLLASSANVYGNSDREIIDESTAPAPANDYAISKLAMEMVARMWQDKLPIVIVRPFNYTGVGQDERFLLPKIVRHFSARGAHRVGQSECRARFLGCAHGGRRVSEVDRSRLRRTHVQRLLRYRVFAAGRLGDGAGTIRA